VLHERFAARLNTTAQQRSQMAIAAELAKGASLPDAVSVAKDYLTAAIFAADALDVGSGRGRGPVHHFHNWWDDGNL